MADEKELTANERVWAAIEAEKATPQPTPPDCLRVRYFKGGGKTPAPADVFRYEDEPGRVALLVQTPQGVKYQPGVYYQGSRHNNGSNRTIANNGTWDYLEGEKIPAWHFNKHKEYIEKRVAAQRRNEDMQAATEANMKAKREAAAV